MVRDSYNQGKVSLHNKRLDEDAILQ